MSSLARPLDFGETLAQCVDDLDGLVDRQRGLRGIRQVRWLPDLDRPDVGHGLDQLDLPGGALAIPLSQGSFDLRMPRMADQDHVAPGAAMTRDLHVDLGHQWTGGVEDAEAALGGFLAHRLRNAVRAEDHGGAARHLAQLLDEHRAARAQALDHEAVVHHLVPDVDGRAEQVQRTLDDVDRAVDASAEAAGVGEQDVQGEAVSGE